MTSGSNYKQSFPLLTSVFDAGPIKILIFCHESFQPGSVGNPWGPVVDGSLVGTVDAFLPDSPKFMRETGNFKRIVVMAGLNKDDGSFFIRK